MRRMLLPHRRVPLLSKLSRPPQLDHQETAPNCHWHGCCVAVVVVATRRWGGTTTTEEEDSVVVVAASSGMPILDDRRSHCRTMFLATSCGQLYSCRAGGRRWSQNIHSTVTVATADLFGRSRLPCGFVKEKRKIRTASSSAGEVWRSVPHGETLIEKRKFFENPIFYYCVHCAGLPQKTKPSECTQFQSS